MTSATITGCCSLGGAVVYSWLHQPLSIVDMGYVFLPHAFSELLSPASVGLFSYCYPATENTPWMEWSIPAVLHGVEYSWFILLASSSGKPLQMHLEEIVYLASSRPKPVSLCLAGSKAWVMGSLQYFLSIPFFIIIFCILFIFKPVSDPVCVGPFTCSLTLKDSVKVCYRIRHHQSTCTFEIRRRHNS